MKRIILFIVIFQLAACVSPQKQVATTDEARLAATPNAAVRRTITNFSQSLQCMDDLYIRYAVPEVYIGASDIPDRTQVVNAGTTEMLITALSTMSSKSNTVRFNVYDPGNPTSLTLLKLHEAHQTSFDLPEFFIRGAITQVDRGVVQEQQSAGIRLEGVFNAAVSKDRGISIVSLDMNMGDIRTLEIMPSISASNSIAVVRTGAAGEFGGTIKKFGALFEMDFTKSEGLHHAVRTLIELGSIELLGKLTRVPYWECLDIETTNPLVQEQVQKWYDTLSRKQLITFIQAKLDAIGYYAGAINGTEDQATKAAIIAYKQNKNLIANSDPDFALYFSLMSDQTQLNEAVLASTAVNIPDKKQTSGTESETPNRLVKTAVDPLTITLTTDRGDKPVYRQGEPMTVQVQASVDAYVYCFYKQWDGSIIKLFPNRFRPIAKRPAAEVLNIPGDDQYTIVMDAPSAQERVMCIASQTDLDDALRESKDPLILGELVEKDLEPISADTLEGIYGVYLSTVKTRPLFQIIDIEIR
ncbi:MAG: DUF4384 domain-containing protein [Arenicellales bacterium]|nr:DUF4384 domain-containing protein [Arenicellales bacterium]